MRLSRTPRLSHRSARAPQPDHRARRRLGNADSSRTILVDELDHGIVFYLPAADIVSGALVPVPGKTSICPYKGEATYLALAGAPEIPVAWRYDRPFAQVAALEDHVAFYQDRVALTVGTI
jgi:uncharacterized protein (DUF427 family)